MGKKYSDLDAASAIYNGDLACLAQVAQTGETSDTGYISRKTTVAAIADKIVNSIEYTSALQTTSKTIVGAINELEAGGGGGGSSTLAGLSDVDITSAANDDSLVYNSSDDEWQNKPITKTVTQAQYDALVAGGTVDPNIVYFISDGVPSPIGHNYSTTEHAVGTWIDGKSVYELVVNLGSSVTLPSQDWYTTNIPNSDKAMILNARSVSPVGMMFPLAASRDSGSTVRLWNMRNSTVACQYIILEYVKASS